MRYLTLNEVLELHRRIIENTGGSDGLRDLGALQSSIAQPRMAFGSAELYPTLTDKTAALGFSLVRNHPFVDGNKRVGHAAMETFLVLNGFEFEASVDDAEAAMLALASGRLSREELASWIKGHVVSKR